MSSDTAKTKKKCVTQVNLLTGYHVCTPTPPTSIINFWRQSSNNSDKQQWHRSSRCGCYEDNQSIYLVLQRQHSTSFRRRDKLSVLPCSWAFKQQWSHPKDRQLPAVPDATTIESICQKLERLLPIYPISCMKYSYHIFVCLFRFWIFFPLKTNSPQIKLVNYS